MGEKCDISDRGMTVAWIRVPESLGIPESAFMCNSRYTGWCKKENKNIY